MKITPEQRANLRETLAHRCMRGSQWPTTQLLDDLESVEAERDQFKTLITALQADNLALSTSESTKVARELIEAKAEIEKLRGALIATGRNMGAFLDDSVSTDFLMLLPEEARLGRERLKAEIERLKVLYDDAVKNRNYYAERRSVAEAELAVKDQEIERLRCLAAFVHKWATRPNMTDAERVSIISNMPGWDRFIKGAKPSAELEEARAAMVEACELLMESRYGNPARSPGHNARLVLEAALKGGDATSTGRNSNEAPQSADFDKAPQDHSCGAATEVPPDAEAAAKVERHG